MSFEKPCAKLPKAAVTGLCMARGGIRMAVSVQAQMANRQSKLAYEMVSWDFSEALKSGQGLMVLDGRSREAYAEEHIPGAVNLPHREVSSDATGNLDKALAYECYCDGVGCNASTKTALKMLSLGFSVKELIGGLDWWKKDGYATMGRQGQQGRDPNSGC